ncbi:hypothetical protein AN958_11066 [Leucoagaricus sp. SymC.cos]|nr:hypothetical protein AN958_11066 [Leucoagaricus sp. SymC.cos]
MLSLSARDWFIAFTCVILHFKFRHRRKRPLSFPPGPQRWPIIKNTLTSILVINNIYIAQDLPENPSTLYSSRVGIKTFFAFMPYGDDWRTHHRMLQQHFTEKHLPRVQGRLIEFVWKVLLPNFLYVGVLKWTPLDPNPESRGSLNFHHPTQRQHDPFVDFAEETFATSTALHAKQKVSQIFAAVTEMTVATFQKFIIGMKRPDVQKKAQQEADLAVGEDRLPEFSDIKSLPCLSAIIKEARSAILHDEDVFPCPQELQPERFLKDGFIRDDLPDPETVATFGFGLCPGAHIGKSAVYITAASLLYLFCITSANDDDGNPISPS